MLLRIHVYSLAIAILAACASAACIVEEHHPSSGGGMAGGGSTSTPPSAGTGSTGSSAQPLLVDVDTGKVMSATPGDGVGVFVEYAAGGKWHVWWTCDTNVSQQSCGMDVRISVASGQIDNPRIQDGASTSESISTTATSVEATGTTTTTLDGVRDYLNAALLVSFRGDPEELLDALLAIERALGRERRVRWAARTIDLDVLWIEGVALEEERLTVPHPRLTERAFAMTPLLDVVPGAIDPRTHAPFSPIYDASMRVLDEWLVRS
jgi:2-amino-4-hydroxy-6-hydroxymethyldihydropteridine diphosphokinase